MTAPPRCPRCETAATGPALHGTRLVLCPACWTVVEPPAPVAPPPTPPPTPPHPELTALPYRPRPRMGPVFPRRFFLGLAFFALVPLVGYLGWSHRRANPEFREYTTPNGEYTAAFPAPPRWVLESADTFEGQLVPGAAADRDTGFWDETYRVRAVWLGPAGGKRNPVEVAVRRAGVRGADAVLVTAPGGYTAAEFEARDAVAKAKTAGRVVVVRDYAYELTVTGRGVARSDRRVQRFFDSFRVGR